VLGEIFYALVIITANGDERVAASFQTREPCIVESQKIRDQGLKAYCFPTNQMTQADIQRQFDQMLILMNQFRLGMEAQK
jgi:hypothetical protein